MSHHDLAQRVQKFAQGHRDQLTPDDMLALGWAAGAISKVPVHEDMDDEMVPRSVRHTRVINEIGDRIIRVRTEANATVDGNPGADIALAKLYAYALDDIGQMVGILSTQPVPADADPIIEVPSG